MWYNLFVEEKNFEISIGHLYPKLLNLYGDMGNIITLTKRCEWRGIKVKYEQIDINDDISDYDIYFIGGGQDKQQEDVARCLLKQDSDAFGQIIEVAEAQAGKLDLLDNKKKKKTELRIVEIEFLETLDR